ncbi:nucleoside:proton symporter [Leptolyngbya sp. FACHB-671]|uniref:NupC/NupG family nucleoside CNT transporter n=1 Tax=Leptolyngbya sp. FACHB-671 TaxID=2692812 RepID=UPI001681E250|nr:nucleoside transporter C-terminal domain-containing protein [Leptolyngbya sp. FACHB-671]MBD2068545.1 nucleoside:proton symporter [Leptolyngbya sp. FACHB-671]
MTDNLLILRVISLIGIFVLCAIAWLFSENRSFKVFPWRLVIMGILLQLVLGFLVFQFPLTRLILQGFSNLLNVVLDAADYGAQFVFGRNLVPEPPRNNPIQPILLSPLAAGGVCAPNTAGEVIPGFCGIRLGYVFAFRALPAVIFFSGFVGLLYNLGVIQFITNIFAKIFYSVMRLSGAEALSGAANIFVGIEAAIVVKPFLPKMTRSELCAILACCFGTAASSTLAIYVNFLRPVFPNILGHLVSASIMAIPACFVLSKILVPETEIPLTAGGIPDERALRHSPDPVDERVEEADFQDAPRETVAGESIERVSPLDAAILGALDGVRMAVSIAAVLILILGLVYLVNQLFVGLASLQESEIAALQPIGRFFSVVSLANILGALFLPLTALTGVSLSWQELWESSVIIGRRLFETAIPPYQALGAAAALPVGERIISDRAVLIVSYALSGFAHLASVGIFVGGTTALIPSRRKDISELGWKALFIGTLATLMIACVAGVFDTGDYSGILGAPAPEAAPLTAPSPSPEETPEESLEEESPDASPVPTEAESPEAEIPSPSPTVSPSPTAPAGQAPAGQSAPSTAPTTSPSPVDSPTPSLRTSPSPSPSPTR